MPSSYATALAEIKQRLQQERLRIVLSANSAMVLLYWDIGRMILERQEREGWGAKVIDRLSADLGEAFPDMRGFSPRNLKYMQAFAESWPDLPIVQKGLAQLPWTHNCVQDQYSFDFLGMADPRREREDEQALIDYIQRFLLELGAEFAFVGRQVKLEVGDDDFIIALHLAWARVSSRSEATRRSFAARSC